ncbi:MAG: allantoicase [Elusimicrobia bacterium]|nr:MAG: allantoicase [Elusimicrobiota bacterium]
MNITDPRAVRVPFTELADLAAAAVGGKAVACSDDFFAPMANLLKGPRAVFIPEKFTPRGKWMDGWESRRKRKPGHDWCVVKLGMPGVVRGVDVDTDHFTGNYPEFASLEACESSANVPPASAWREIVAKVRLQGGTRNLLPVADPGRVTHLRLNIHPDGGVARLRVHGVVRPDWGKVRKERGLVDLAALENGGVVAATSDSYFGPKDNLILPGRSKTMGGGWETRRKRVPGHDWIVVALGRAGRPRRVEVDTNHFKGNFPESVSLEGCSFKGRAEADAFDLGCDLQAWPGAAVAWKPLLPRTKVRAHTRHMFALKGALAVTHVRLRAYTDGGVSRLRVWAEPA